MLKKTFLLFLIIVLNNPILSCQELGVPCIYKEPPFNWRFWHINDDIEEFLFLRDMYVNSDRCIAMPADEPISDNFSWMEKEKLAVSLGYNCNNAGQFNNAKIRYRSFPFDWCFSDIEGIMACIKNDFKDFLNFKNLTIDGKVLVTDSKYNITIVHDFPFQVANNVNSMNMWQLVEEQYDDTYKKFMRRVDRFRKLSEFKGTLYFFRGSHISKIQSVKLLNVLRDQFKNQNIILVVVNDTSEFQKSWDIPGLRNFYIPNLEKRTFEFGLFTQIYKDVGLL